MKSNRFIPAACLLVILAMAMNIQAAQSPFSRGSFLISGGGTYVNLSSDDIEEDPNVVLIYPSFGYFLTDKLSFGAQILLASVSVGDDDLSAMAIGPQVTYYITNATTDANYSGRAVPYLTASALIGQVTDGPDEISGHSFTFGVGVLAMMAKNIGGFGELNYSFDKLTNDQRARHEEYKGGRVAMQIGLRLFVW